MVAPLPQDTVVIRLLQCDDAAESNGDENVVAVEMKVVKQREPRRGLAMSRVGGSGQQNDGMGVLAKLLKSDFAAKSGTGHAEGPQVESCPGHWMNVTVMLQVELTRLPLLEKLFFDNNKLTVLPPELGVLNNLIVLTADSNMLVSVPVELR